MSRRSTKPSAPLVPNGCDEPRCQLRYGHAGLHWAKGHIEVPGTMLRWPYVDEWASASDLREAEDS